MSITPEMILAERKRRKLSRGKFAELTGLRPGAIASIERHGRLAKPEELEILAQFVPDENATEPTGDVWLNGIYMLDEDVEAEELELPIVSFPAAPPVVEAPAAPTKQWDHRFSNSELGTWKRCRRKWYLGYFRGLRLKEQSVTGARELGTQVHKALEAWYVTEGQPRTDPREALERVLVEDWTKLTESANPDTGLDPEAVQRYKDQCELGRAMIAGYVDWIAETGVDEDLEVVAPEQQIIVEVLDNIGMMGKLDVEVRRRSDGAHLFIDHKTVGNLTSPLRTLHLNEQMLTYMLLQRLSTPDGELSAGALYNMLRKVKRTARANPPFYERIEVQHNPTEIESFFTRLTGTIADILETIKLLHDGADHLRVAYPTPTSDCSWDCDFLAICSMMDDGSRVEDFISEMYVEANPLERYDKA